MEWRREEREESEEGSHCCLGLKGGLPISFFPHLSGRRSP